MAEYYSQKQHEHYSVLYAQMHVSAGAHCLLLHEVEACFRDIFARLSLEYLAMTKRRRGNQRLEDRIQSVELGIGAEEVRELLCLSKRETTCSILPQVHTAVHKETIKLIDTMVKAVKSASSDEKLCAGFICDANMLFEAVMEEVRESAKDAQGLVDEFFRDAQLQFFEDLLAVGEVRSALMRAQNQWPAISLLIAELQADADGDSQVSFSTSDLLQQMSIEQVVTYINSEDSPQASKRKKRRKGKKKSIDSHCDLSKMSEREFSDLASAFAERLEHCEQKSRRKQPLISATWMQRLLTLSMQAC